MIWFALSPLADPHPNPPASQHDPRAGTRTHASAEEERILLGRVLQRDQTAMAEIFDRYSRMAYSIALRVLQDPAQAEDVMQDVFFQIWQNPKTFVAERGSLGAWIAVVVRNRSIDTIRRRKPSEPVEEVVLAAGTDLASEVEHNTMIERVRSVLNKLPVDQRETMELAFFKGLTHAEIAKEKGEPLGTIKTRIRTALINLRKAFQP